MEKRVYVDARNPEYLSKYSQLKVKCKLQHSISKRQHTRSFPELQCAASISDWNGSSTLVREERVCTDVVRGIRALRHANKS